MKLDSILLSNIVPKAYCTLIEHMQFYIEPNISCSRFFADACFTEESLKRYRETHTTNDLSFTELGSFLSDRMQHNLFIDIPCGNHTLRDQSLDVNLVPLVKKLGADQYWEVDIDADVLADRIPQPIKVVENNSYQLSHSLAEIGTRKESVMEVHTMQDDIVGFLSKLSTNVPVKTIYLSALQPHKNLCDDPQKQETIVIPYLTALYNELDRLCTKDDTLILNSSDMLVTGIDQLTHMDIHPALALAKKGFDLVRRCSYNKVQIFRKL